MTTVAFLFTTPEKHRKKYTVRLVRKDGERTTIHFGAKGYDDYTTHGDDERKKRYLARHAPRENWGARGVETAGFWSRWLLWNKQTLEKSMRDVEKRFGVRFQTPTPVHS